MRDDNKQLYKQVASMFGDLIMALVCGLLGVVALFGIMSAIWNLIAQV